MTNEQFLVLVACLWLAPHTPKSIAFINCSLMLVLAAAIGLGWKS